MDTNKLEKTILINAPVHAIFEYVREPENLPKLCPHLISVGDVQRLPNGEKSFQWEYKLVNVHFFGTSNVTECDVHHCLISRIQGGISGTMKWTFQLEDTSTHVTLAVEYTLPPLFVQKHGLKAVTHETEATATAMLEALRATMEQAVAHTPVEEAKVV